MCTRPGRPKASVLPEPVAAMPTRSRPDRMMGQHCAWMGEGCEKPLVDCSSSCEKPAEPKDQIRIIAQQYLSASACPLPLLQLQKAPLGQDAA